jgi:DNA-binding NarL/FixJ family response regulator
MEVATKLAIADPNTLLREGLTNLLHGVKDFLVVGEAANDVETLDLVQEAKPDVLLLERDTPKLGAVPILLAIKEQKSPTRVLILSLLPEESQLLNTARAGARGYILKSTPSVTLAEAIREVSRGRIWVDRNAGCADTFALLAHQANTNNEIGVEMNPLDVLTRKETQILYLIAKGATNEEIANKLSVAVTTVKAHLYSMFRKLNVENRTQAALLLMQVRSRDGQDHSGQSLLRSASIGG